MKYYLLIVWQSIKWMFRVNLGDFVWYNNKQYVVVNGVRCNSWRLSNLENDDNGWVLRKDCKKVWTINNMIGSFKSGYGFYMHNWFSIWKRSGIELWMKSCNIW